MNIYEFIEFYKSFKHVNDAIPNMNKGGCAIFAHALAKEIYKHVSTDVKVVTLGKGGDMREFNRDSLTRVKEMNNNQLTPINCYNFGIQLCHLMVSVVIDDVEYLVDSTGVYNDLEESMWSEYYGLDLNTELTINETGELAGYDEGWNSQFDRNFIPKIYNFVQKRFGKLVRAQTQQTLTFA